MADTNQYNWTLKDWTAYYKEKNPTWSPAKLKTAATNALTKKAAEVKANPTLKLSDDEIINDLKINHPQWAQWVLEHPELKKTVIAWSKIKGGPTQEQIDAAVYPTKIVQEYNSIQQNLDKLKALSPGEYKSRVDTATNIVDTEIARQGLKDVISTDNRQKIIDAALNNGWSSQDQRLTQAVGAYFSTKATKAAATGTYATNLASQLRAMATKYMIPMSDQTLEEMGKAIAQGNSTVADQESWFKQQAASLYPFMAGTIDTTSPETWFSPLRQLISSNLGVNPANVDFNDPSGKWMNLAVVRDPATGANVARSNADAVKEMRTNPIYGYDKTPGGIEAGFNIGTKLRAMMGFGE